jgi:putative heme-binding domain-containing protein
LIGPDLTAASRRFNRRDLLTAMVEPSKVIAENYRSLQIVTDDGKSFVGQVVLGGDYRAPSLRLAIDPARPQSMVEIDKNRIEVQTTSAVSWMPSGLLDTFTREQIFDLVAYIESGGVVAP